MANPLDSLTSISKPNNSNNNNNANAKVGGPKKEKKSVLKVLSSPFIKELRGIGLYAVITCSVLGTSYYIMSDAESPYYMGHLTEERKLVQETEARILSSASQVETLRNDASNLSLEIQDKERVANEASLLKTPLEQGFYFTAYLDALATKFDVEIKNLDVQVKEEGDNTNMAPVPIEQAVTTQDYSLLPIAVTMQGSYGSIVSLFNDIYTKRIIYDRNLKLTNNSDGTVTVSTLITFDNNFTASPTPNDPTAVDPATGLPVVTPPATVPTVPVTPPGTQAGTVPTVPEVPQNATTNVNAGTGVNPQPIEGGNTNGN